MKIDLSFPCNEDRSKMTDTAKGKFCAQCSKEVIDFTEWDKDEILAYLSKQNSCGIFKKGQLDSIKSKPLEKITLPPQISLLKRAAASIALLSVVLFSCGDQDVNAQSNNTEKPKEVKPVKNCQPDIMGVVAVKPKLEIDSVEIEMGEAIPMPDHDTLLMGDIMIEPPEPLIEDPLMGIPAILPNENEVELGKAIIKKEE